MGRHVLQTQGAAPSGQSKRSGENKNAKALLPLKEEKGQRNRCLRSGQRAEDPNKIPRFGSLGNPPEEPDVCCGRCTESYMEEVKDGPVISNERCVFFPRQFF